MNKKLKAIIAALMISSKLASPALASVTPDQLAQIRALTDSDDVAGLRAYLAQNPQILEVNSPLTRSLQEFLESTDNIFGRLFNGTTFTQLQVALDTPDIY